MIFAIVADESEGNETRMTMPVGNQVFGNSGVRISVQLRGPLAELNLFRTNLLEHDPPANDPDPRLKSTPRSRKPPYPSHLQYVKSRAVFHGQEAVAALKHVARRRLQSGASGVFHGQEAVAALKHDRQSLESSGDLDVFHGQEAVAALKLRNCGFTLPGSWVFHGQEAVAALKQKYFGWWVDTHTGLPRPRGRGRIEARQAALATRKSLASSTAKRPWPH